LGITRTLGPGHANCAWKTSLKDAARFTGNAPQRLEIAHGFLFDKDEQRFCFDGGNSLLSFPFKVSTPKEMGRRRRGCSA
jgi:hypothetical protein